MPTPLQSTPTATVVDLAGFRRSDKHIHNAKQPLSAELLSMRQHLSYQASVEIDNLQWIESQYSDLVQKRVVKEVRAILDREFGRLRVHRYRQLFIAKHHSVEMLISGLLRVQFHTLQLNLPMVNKMAERIDVKAVSLTWGVGRNSIEADSERVKRRRL